MFGKTIWNLENVSKLVGKHNQGYDVYILENIFILQANHSLFVLWEQIQKQFRKLTKRSPSYWF